MDIAERIILAFSKKDFDGYHEHSESLNHLELLEREYPDLKELVAGKKVLDFGCGYGYQALGLKQRYGADVVGMDINHICLEHARKVTNGQVRLTDNLDGEKFDVVVSQDSMEHFSNPVLALKQMIFALRPGGRILMTFGPPWYSPYGSHMHFFCKIPWLNLLFPETAVMKARSRYRNDGAKRYEEVESGLNKMSLLRFEKIIGKSGLKFERLHYRCVRGWTFLSKIPVVREFACNHVTAILRL